MIQAGKCIKCGGAISKGNAPLHTYCEYEFEAENAIFAVGICSSCSISESEYDEILKQVQESMPNINFGKIKSLKAIKDYQTILLELQGGCCNNCKKPLSDNFVLNNGRIICEFCKRGREENAPLEKSFRSPEAGRMSEREKPRERRNVRLQDMQGVKK